MAETLALELRLLGFQEAQGHLRKTGQALEGVAVPVQSLGTKLSAATRTARFFAGSLLADVNPALAGVTIAATSAGRATQGLGLPFMGLSVALAALVTVVGAYIRMTQEAARAQAEFSEALRTADPGLLTARLKALTTEVKELEAAQARIAGTGGPLMVQMLRDLGGQATTADQQILALLARAREFEALKDAIKSVGEIELAGLVQPGALAQEEFRHLTERAKQFAEALKITAASVGDVDLAGLVDEIAVARLVLAQAAIDAKSFAEGIGFVAVSVGDVELAGLMDEIATFRLGMQIAAEEAKKFSEELQAVAVSMGEIELAGIVDENAIFRLVDAMETAGTLLGGLAEGWRRIQEDLGAVGAQTAALLQTTYAQVFAGIGQAMAQTVFFGQKIGAAFEDFMRNVAASIVAMLVEITAKMIVAAAWAATLKLLLAALGAGGGGGGFLDFVGSFQAGGRVPRTGMALVHAGERVLPAEGTPMMVPAPVIQINAEWMMFDDYSVEALTRRLTRELQRQETRAATRG